MAERNFENRTLFHGDNLGFLRGMNSETVDLIATDPPFNKSKDFHATPDSLARGARFQDRWSWRDDIHDDWLLGIQRDHPEVWSVIDTAKRVYGDDMGAFLCFMAVRLLEMHRVLQPEGSIYLHIDHTAHAYVKALLDAVFGQRNFRNEIVWAYTGPSNTPRWFPRKHDTILFYVKSDAAKFHRDRVRVPYHEETLARRGRVEGEQSIISPSVENTGRRTNMQVEAGFGSGKVPEDWWADITSLTNQVEMVGYPTQKPLALYERIILASSSEGDMVLDPFAGCATTPIAAERLGRQWVGMDIWDGALDIVRQRMEDNRQLIADPNPTIHYETTPPNAQTATALLSSGSGRRADGRDSDTLPHASSTASCLWTSAHSARDAGETMALTLAFWKWTTSGQNQMVEATHTTTSRCFARRAIRRSWTA